MKMNIIISCDVLSEDKEDKCFIKPTREFFELLLNDTGENRMGNVVFRNFSIDSVSVGNPVVVLEKIMGY